MGGVAAERETDGERGTERGSGETGSYTDRQGESRLDKQLGRERERPIMTALDWRQNYNTGQHRRPELPYLILACK